MSSTTAALVQADASHTQNAINENFLTAFIGAQREAFTRAYEVLVATNTLTATRTFQAFVRVPNTDYVLALNPPDLWKGETLARAVVASVKGEVIYGPASAGGQGRRYADVFLKQPDIQVVIHFHGAYLGAWAGAHRSLPLLYAPAQRHTKARAIPIFIDRREGEPAFINQVLAQDPNTPAILEANGGATFWGEDIISVAQYIVILEEGAYFQAIAETLGGTQDFGPGTLEQQWAMGFAKSKAIPS